MTYTQLSYEERVQIEVLEREGYGIRMIARILKRSPSTNCRELGSNIVKDVYDAEKAYAKVKAEPKGLFGRLNFL
jgi:IS30 family transposase